MNGRIYDPLIGRFLSADKAIQSPLNLQSYNRYSYVMNNPLTMTDPTGWYSILGLEFTDGGGVSGFFQDSASYAGSAFMGGVGDNAVAGYKAGEGHMELAMTEISNAHSAGDVGIGVLGAVASVGDAVGTVMAVTPEGKAESAAVQGVEKVAVTAERAAETVAARAEGSARTAESRLEGVVTGVDSKVPEKVDVHPLDPDAKPYGDITGKSYEKGSPDKVVIDHLDNRAAGGHPTDPANLDPKSWEANSRKAGFEGNLAKDRENMIKAGMDPADVDKALAGEKKWIKNDAHPVPVDPEKLKKLPQQ